MHDFTKRSRPLVVLTKKDRPFVWTEECESSFNDLKQALISPDAMGYQMNKGFFILNVDASEVGIKVVCSQIQDGRKE